MSTILKIKYINFTHYVKIKQESDFIAFKNIMIILGTRQVLILNKQNDVNTVAILGIGANTLLFILKLSIGFFSNSQAMIADGLNSAGDVFSSLLTYVGNKISSKPSDHNHPFGHGKAEYIFSMIISFSLFLVAYSIVKSSITAIIKQQLFTYSFWLIIIAITTIIVKIFLYLFAKKIGRKYDSLLAIANSEDHRNDVFLTSGTLLSIILGKFGIYWVDGIIGILISLWIAYTGFQIFMQAYNVLMDTTIDSKIKNDIIFDIKKINGVDHIDSISAKPIGLNYILIVKVSVNGSLTVTEGHTISAKIKNILITYNNIDDVIVHINPC